MFCILQKLMFVLTSRDGIDHGKFAISVLCAESWGQCPAECCASQAGIKLVVTRQTDPRQTGG